MAIEAEKPNPEMKPPDGGLEAWTQVLGAHFLFFNSWWVALGYELSRLVLLFITFYDIGVS